jgi:hypothetical protein
MSTLTLAILFNHGCSLFQLGRYYGVASCAYQRGEIRIDSASAEVVILQRHISALANGASSALMRGWCIATGAKPVVPNNQMLAASLA